MSSGMSSGNPVQECMHQTVWGSRVHGRGGDDGFSAPAKNERVRQRQGRAEMLWRGAYKRWQESVTSKMNTYRGECMLLHMVWRERIGRAGVSREVKRGGSRRDVIVKRAAACCWNEVAIGGGTVVEMMLERREAGERCCSCVEHVGSGDIIAYSKSMRLRNQPLETQCWI